MLWPKCKANPTFNTTEPAAPAHKSPIQLPPSPKADGSYTEE